MTKTLDKGGSDAFRFFWPLWLSVGITLALVVHGVLTVESPVQLIKENGAVENASFLIFLCGALGFAVLRPDLAFGRSWQILAILLLFSARELDFDKRFTDKGVLQLKLYSGDYPLDQKLIGAAVVLFILVVLYRLVRHGTGPLLRGLRDGTSWAWGTALSVVTVVVAKTIDGAGRKLEPYGILLSSETSRALSVVEEIGELGFAFLLVFAICSWVRRDASSA